MFYAALLFVFIANLANTALTDIGLRAELVRELNPLMDMLYRR